MSIIKSENYFELDLNLIDFKLLSTSLEIAGKVIGTISNEAEAFKITLNKCIKSVLIKGSRSVISDSGSKHFDN